MAPYRVWCVDLITGSERAGWLTRRADFDRTLRALFGQVFRGASRAALTPDAQPQYGAFDSAAVQWVECAQLDAAAVLPWEVVLYMVPDVSSSVAMEYERRLIAKGLRFGRSTEPPNILGLTVPTPAHTTLAVPCCAEVHVTRSFGSVSATSSTTGRMSGEMCARVAMHEIMHNKLHCEIHAITNDPTAICAADVTRTTDLKAPEIALLRRDLRLSRLQLQTGCTLFNAVQQANDVSRMRF